MNEASARPAPAAPEPAPPSPPLAPTNRPPALAVDYTADLPGGRLRIVVRPSGAIDLTGPAVVTAQGTVRLTLPSSPGPPAGTDVGTQGRSRGSKTDLFRRSHAEHVEG